MIYVDFNKSLLTSFFYNLAKRLILSTGIIMRALNVFGEPIITCSEKPMTGFYRNGCCETDEDDEGTHVVCAVMTDEFLQFSLSRGNDLISPRPIWQFPGLKAGDRWCICANRWIEAYKAGKAPLIVLEATHEKILDYVSINELVKYAFKNQI